MISKAPVVEPGLFRAVCLVTRHRDTFLVMSERDPFDTAAQERARAEISARDERLAKAEVEDVKWLMSDKRGRRIIWRLLEKAGVYRSSFTGDNSTFFLEGKRVIGLEFLGLVAEHSPTNYARMLTERGQ